MADYDVPPPDWLTVGATVALLYTPGFGAPTIRTTTVERLTKRDIILADGTRYRHTDRRVFNVTGTARTIQYRSRDETRPILVGVDDPQVARARQEIAVARADSAVRATFEAWRTRHTVEEAEELQDALTAWITAVRARAAEAAHLTHTTEHREEQ